MPRERQSLDGRESVFSVTPPKKNLNRRLSFASLAQRVIMEQRKVTNRYSSLKSLLYRIRDSLIFASITLRFYTENKHRTANENAYNCLYIVASAKMSYILWKQGHHLIKNENDSKIREKKIFVKDSLCVTWIMLLCLCIMSS